MPEGQVQTSRYELRVNLRWHAVQTKALLHTFVTDLPSSLLRTQINSGRPEVSIQQMAHLLGVIAGVAHDVLAPTRWPPGGADMLLCIVVTCGAQRLPCCMCSNLLALTKAGSQSRSVQVPSQVNQLLL